MNNRKKEIQLKDLGIETVYTLEDIPSIPSSLFPSLTMKSELRMPDTTLRAYLYLKSLHDKGSYGDIRIAARVEPGTTKNVNLLVKSPRIELIHLQTEAILQYLAHKCLLKHEIPWAVPRVYDIFSYHQKIHFSMDHIKGKFLHEWFAGSSQPDTDFLAMMAQLSIFLCLLHQCLGLDHRDLKANNLLLSPHPCQLRFQYYQTIYTLECPFQVHILDFGFACLGDLETSEAFLNLGDGVLPKIDPCPKEGRDLFQFLLSVLCIQSIRNVLSSQLLQWIEPWTGKKFQSMAQKLTEDTRWIYLLTSSSTFTSAKSTPYSILKDIMLLAPSMFSRASV